MYVCTYVRMYVCTYIQNKYCHVECDSGVNIMFDGFLHHFQVFVCTSLSSQFRGEGNRRERASN